MVIANYAANLILKCALLGTGASAPAGMWAAAFNGDPLGAGSELTVSNGYGRAELITAAIYGTAASGGSINNTVQLNWPTATGSWTTPWDHILFTDTASSTGNAYIGGPCTSRTVVNTQTPFNAIGALGISATANIGAFLADMVLNWICRGGVLTPPSNMYLVPFTGNPLSGGVELTTNGASRILIPTFGTPSGGSATNTGTATWGSASGAWAGAFSWVAYMDASSGGNIWLAQPLVTAFPSILTGDPVSVAASGLVVPLT